MFCVTADPLLEQANYCEATAQRLSDHANKYSSKVKKVFDDKHMTEETADILGYVDD